MLRKATVSGKLQVVRGTKGESVTDKITGNHILLPSIADARHGATGFHVALLGFPLSSDSFLFFIPYFAMVPWNTVI